jgi:UDP-N-acetyl-D-mannosaminuronate dehydrogenase
VAFNRTYFSRLYEDRLRDLLSDCRSIAILGLAYTPDAKMHKLSPAFDALECLKGTPRLRLHDPYYSPEEVDDICGVAALSFPEDLADCDGIVLVTAHTPYLTAPVERHVRAGTVVVDNFGAWRNRAFAPGVRYLEVGRPRAVDGAELVDLAEPASSLTD